MSTLGNFLKLKDTLPLQGQITTREAAMVGMPEDSLPNNLHSLKEVSKLSYIMQIE
jgi:hypothetical protein